MNSAKSYYSFFTWFFVLTFGVAYGVLPLVYFVDDYGELAGLMSGLTVIAIAFYLLGLRLNLHMKSVKKKFFHLKFSSLSNKIFALYLATMLVIFITASNIPLIESLKGADVYQLVLFREMFLKQREGWESLLSYIITIIDSAILPYLILESFIRKYKFRYFFIAIFLLYSISFLEKAYVFKIILPLFALLFFVTENKVKFLAIAGGSIVLIVFFMFAISKSDDNIVMQGSYVEPFFSILYKPQSVSTAILWRTIAIPIITALDGLDVFKNQFFSEYFYGRTSSLLAFVTGQERLNFERWVYQNQFGGSETGNANQTYIVEAFINFGYAGVALFSYFTGRLVRMIIKTNNVALIAIAPLFLYNLFSSGLIGNLFSNGFILFFLIVKYIKLKDEKDEKDEKMVAENYHHT